MKINRFALIIAGFLFITIGGFFLFISDFISDSQNLVGVSFITAGLTMEGFGFAIEDKGEKEKKEEEESE